MPEEKNVDNKIILEPPTTKEEVATTEKASLPPMAMSDGKIISEKEVVVDDVVKKKKKAKKILLKVAFILFNIIAILFVILLENKEEGGIIPIKEIGRIIGNNFGFFAIGLLMYAVHVISDAVCYYLLVRHAGYRGVGRKRLTLKVSILGKYYDNITPWNTGGQPFQMAYMNKNGIDGATACSTPLIKYSIRIFTVNTIILFIFIFSKVQVPTFMKFFAYFGLLFSSILPIILLVFSKNVPALMRITEKIVKLLHKMKIVKDYDKQVAKFKELMDNFMAAFKFVGSSKITIVAIAVLQIINTLAITSIPYFVIRSFGVANIGFYETLTMCMFVTYGSSFFPTPGASGASEMSFYAIFAQTLNGGYLFWGILIWRAIVFYLPICLGLLVYLFDWLIGTKKIEAVKSLNWLNKKTINKHSKEK